MEIKGKIYKILPQSEVTLNDGTKKIKGGFVISTEGEYPKKVAFELFGEERLSLLTGLREGNLVKVNFIPMSFEGKDGRYYSTLRCTNVFPLVTATAPSPSVDNATPFQNKSFDALSPDEALPFDNDLSFA
ncbi:MAG: DUF3127 domain-containing protein [Bacteroidales bacterium]|nr:DUF3127 domain-containing protein [Bacteroidales bacterium]